MPARQPSPFALGAAFSVADAVASGVSPHALRRVALRSPHPGVRASGEPPADDDLRHRCAELAPRLREWQFFSHETALALEGVPVPACPYRVGLHVSAHRPAREPRIPSVVGHRLQTRESVATEASGLPLEDPVRAWRQVGTLWHLPDLVAAADAMISGPHPLATLPDLYDEIASMGDVRGGILTRALSLARVGPRSPRETRLRLVLQRAGLPEPEINWTLRDADGNHLAELDLAYPRYRVAPEYDGRVHAEDAQQFARDADRWDRIRAAGWDHVRILNHHMSNGGAPAIRKVADALVRAGWRPS